MALGNLNSNNNAGGRETESVMCVCGNSFPLLFPFNDLHKDTTTKGKLPRVNISLLRPTLEEALPS